MSLFRSWQVAATKAEAKSGRKRRAARAQRDRVSRRYRRLLIDPLEVRVLLTVVPMNTTDMLASDPSHYNLLDNVAPTYTSPTQQTTGTTGLGATAAGGHAVATDHNGDFVVVWTTYDAVGLDPATGKPWIDPTTGQTMTDANIYARYLTNEVQRLTLPAAAATSTAANPWRMWLNYNYEVQELSITASSQPADYVEPNTPVNLAPTTFVPTDITGTFTLTYNGVSTAPISFSELQPNGLPVPLSGPTSNAAAIQSALNLVPGLEQVKVQAVDSGHFQILFPALPPVLNVGDAPPWQMISVAQSPPPAWTSGFLPAVEVTETSHAFQVGGTTGIPIIGNNPTATANYIQQYFTMAVAAQTNVEAPVFEGPPDTSDVAIGGESNQGDPYTAPVTLGSAQPMPLVVASPHPVPAGYSGAGDQGDTTGAVHFDITFQGNWGTEDAPPLTLAKLTDQSGAVVLSQVQSAKILKESSPQFRVNAPEPSDPNSPFPTKTNQTNASVAMAADGGFVITWQSQVTDATSFGSQSDIYARRFEPTGYVDDPTQVAFIADNNFDGVPDTPIQCVRPLGSEFRVNTYTANAQVQPDVAMDPNGNFVIVWADQGQDYSFFNGVVAQRFDRDGNRIGNEILVSQYKTNVNFSPYVAMDNRSDFAVTWGLTSDPHYEQGLPFVSSLQIEVLGAQNNVLIAQGQLAANGAGGDSSVVFDNNDNFTVVWDEAGGTSNIGQVGLETVYGEEWELYQHNANTGALITDANGNPLVSGNVLRPEFRVNSADFNIGSNVYWPNGDAADQVAMDADGDMVVAYEGFAPEISQDVIMPGTYFADLVNRPENSDLIPYLTDTTGQPVGLPAGTTSTLFAGPGFYGIYELNQLTAAEGGANIDTAIEDILIHAENAVNPVTGLPIPAASASQLGRIRAILDQVAGLLRGDANGVMFTQYDASPQAPYKSQLDILSSDSVANNTRDGQDEQFFIALDEHTLFVPGQDPGIHNGPVHGGTFPIRVNGVTGTVTVVPAPNNGPGIDVLATQANLVATLRSLQSVGKNWPIGNNDVPEGPVDVRLVTPEELMARVGTPWDITTDADGFPTGIDPLTDYVWEVTFQGELHDTPTIMYMPANNGNLQTTTVKVPSIIQIVLDPKNLGQFTYTLTGTSNPNPVNYTYDPTNPPTAGTIAAELNIPVADVTVTYTTDATAPFQTITTVTITIYPDDNIAGTYVPPQVGQGQQPPNPHGTITVSKLQDAKLLTDSASDPTIMDYQNANLGIAQTNSAVSMTPDGNFVMAWTQTNQYTDGGASNQTIQYRQFNESTDTAGPQVAGLVGPGGRPVQQNGQIVNAQGLSCIVVTFDKEVDSDLDPTSPLWNGSVYNPKNWELMKSGTQAANGIRQIYYGVNEANWLSQSQLAQFSGLSAPADNCYEAVLVLNGSGLATGAATALGTGHYSLVVLASLTDRAGVPLNRTGYQPQGALFQIDFDVLMPSASSDTLVSTTDPSAGGQYTRPANDPDAPNPNSVASDANGDMVVVWTSTDPTHPGIYAKMYQRTWTNVNGVRQLSKPTVVKTYSNPANPATEWLNDEIQVTADPTAQYASVARDAAGDFIVTWAAQNAYGSSTDFDIYARRYNAAGNPILPSNPVNAAVNQDTFRVNTYTAGAQRYPTVAMDNQGDFVITWQSYGEDGSGYGIYAQRYDPRGLPVGGTDDAQLITFVGHPMVDFKLQWNGNSSGLISYRGNAAAIVSAVEAAMAQLGGPNVQVQVKAVSGTQILIQFVGLSAGQDQPQIYAQIVNLISGDPGATISVSTTIHGNMGEFQVNDTTANNQVYPDVAMGEQGDFVITWTSFGQDGDAPYQSNVYAKKFISNQTLVQQSTQNQLAGFSGVSQSNPVLKAVRQVVTEDAPKNHVVTAPSAYDGVVELEANSLLGVDIGSGVLLTGGWDILTAAHVVCEDLTTIPVGSVVVDFDLPTGRFSLTATQIIVNPAYVPDNGTGLPENDLAIVVLPQIAPPAAQRYNIYLGANELAQSQQTPFIMAGYGLTGQGATGEVPNSFGVKHSAENEWQVLGTRFNGMPMASFGIPAAGNFASVPGSLLSYDFDNGNPANDAFQQLFGIVSPNLGAVEGAQAHGDSGGPEFINGQIAGITDFVLDPLVSDINGGANPGSVEYGDVFFDSRVSFYAPWINSVLAAPTNSTPEFRVNVTIANNQKWSTVAMDAQGDFVITWTSYGQDGTGNGYGPGAGGVNGVYARRYNSSATATSGEFLVNTTTADNHQLSRVAMDAAGDFTIAWEGYQDRPLVVPGSTSPSPPDSPNSYGIFAQRYVRTSLIGQTSGGQALYGPDGELGSEFEANSTTPGDQRSPAVGMDDAGDFMIVWAGNGVDGTTGVSDTQGIWCRIYDQSADKAGPVVGQVWDHSVPPSAPINNQILNGNTITDLDPSTNKPVPTQLIVTFGENLNTLGGASGPNSVLNPTNWSLSLNGTALGGAVTPLAWFNRDPKYNTFEVVLQLNGGPGPSVQPLSAGTYVLTAFDSIQDIFGNALDGNLDGAPGGNFQITFNVSTTPGGANSTPNPPTPGPPGTPLPGGVDTPINTIQQGNQNQPAIATDAQGDYVVAWTSYGQGLDTAIEGDIVVQRFDRYGKAQGGQLTANAVTTGNQYEPDVAMDSFGDFVVVWTSNENQAAFGYDVNARVFDSFGNPLTNDILVNQYRLNDQVLPKVAMDSVGDFVVTWTSYGQDGSSTGVFARRFSLEGLAASPEFQVNTFTQHQQQNSDVAMDSNGDFGIIWQSYQQDGADWGIFAQRYNSAGTPQGGEFQVSSSSNDKQVTPSIAMDANGDIVAAWASFGQDAPGGYGVYDRRFNAAGTPQGGEQLVNTFTPGYQWQPQVSMSATGGYVVTWSSYGQESTATPGYGIFARIYDANGNEIKTGAQPGEFQVNSTITGNLGDQVTPDVAVDSNGNFAIAWAGPDASGTGIYARRMVLNAAPYNTQSVSVTQSLPTNQRGTPAQTVTVSPIVVTGISPAVGAVLGGSVTTFNVSLSGTVDPTTLPGAFGVSGVAATVGTPTEVGTTNTWQVPVTHLVAGALTFTASTSGHPILDMSGGMVASASGNYTINLTPPTCVGTTLPGGGTLLGASPTIDLTFSEPVTGVTTSALTLGGPAGAAASVTSATNLGGNRYRFQLAGLANGGLTLTLTSAIEDLYGNAFVPLTWSATADARGPAISSQTPTAASVISGTSTNIVVTFAVPVSGVSAAALKLSGPAAATASIGTVTSLGNNAYQFAVSKLLGGPLTVTLGAPIADGNGVVLAPVAWNYTVQTPPTVIGTTLPGGGMLAGTSPTIDLTFSEPVTGVTTNALTLTGSAAASASVANVSNLGGNAYRFQLANLANGGLTLTLTSAIQDLYGNHLVPLTWPATVDASGPTVSSHTPTAGSVISGTSTNIVVAFAVPVSGVSAAALKLSGPAAATASIGTVTSLGNNAYQFAVSKLLGGPLTVTLGAPIADGNGVVLSPVSWSYTVQTPPTVIGTSLPGGGTLVGTSPTIDLTFSEPVTGVTPSVLTLSGPAAAAASVTGVSSLGGNAYRFQLAGLTGGGLTLTLTSAIQDLYGNHFVPLTWSATVVTVQSTVVSQYLYYANSKYDNAAKGGTVDKARATNKHALLPGQTATSANYSDYGYGINGILVDIAGLEKPTNFGLSDLTFKYGDTTSTSAWTTAPAPAKISVNAGGGDSGSDEVVLTWANNAIPTGNWLQVTVAADQNTGLASPYTFYFGNLIGDVTGDGKVTAADVTAIQKQVGKTAGIASAYDVNRDGKINAADVTLVKKYVGDTLAMLIAPSVVPHAAVASAAQPSSSTAAATNSSTSSVAAAYDAVLKPPAPLSSVGANSPSYLSSAQQSVSFGQPAPKKSLLATDKVLASW